MGLTRRRSWSSKTLPSRRPCARPRRGLRFLTTSLLRRIRSSAKAGPWRSLARVRRPPRGHRELPRHLLSPLRSTRQPCRRHNARRSRLGPRKVRLPRVPPSVPTFHRGQRMVAPLFPPRPSCRQARGQPPSRAQGPRFSGEAPAPRSRCGLALRRRSSLRELGFGSGRAPAPARRHLPCRRRARRSFKRRLLKPPLRRKSWLRPSRRLPLQCPSLPRSRSRRRRRLSLPRPQPP
jgi:hypothetical protein